MCCLSITAICSSYNNLIVTTYLHSCVVMFTITQRYAFYFAYLNGSKQDPH